MAPLGGDDADIAAFLAGTPFTVLLQQRDVLTLHAASVATDHGAGLPLGRSGFGKSSLAATLVEHRFPPLNRRRSRDGASGGAERRVAHPGVVGLRRVLRGGGG